MEGRFLSVQENQLGDAVLGLWAGLLRGHREVSCVACPARCTQLGSRRWDHENKLTTVPPPDCVYLLKRFGRALAHAGG